MSINQSISQVGYTSGERGASIRHGHAKRYRRKLYKLERIYRIRFHGGKVIVIKYIKNRTLNSGYFDKNATKISSTELSCFSDLCEEVYQKG